MQLIFELEYIAGRACYNPHSTDGYTGDVGKWFRYPVWANIGTKEKPAKHKFSYKVEYVEPENIASIEYKFGANEMSIGKALRDILEFLEERYDIDFNELEEKFKNKSVN